MDLFEIKLNEQGIAAVRKFRKLATGVFILIIITSVIFLIETWSTFSFVNEVTYAGSASMYFQMKVVPFLITLTCILSFVQVYYYLKTSKQLSLSIDTHDEELFNRAFISLFRNSFFALLTISTTVIIETVRIILAFMD